MLNMKRWLTSILLVIAAVTCVAQDSISAVDRFLVPQGQWSIVIDWNPYTWAWTRLPHRQLTDTSGFGVFNLGLGTEWTYRDNRSLRLMGHAALIGNNDYSVFERFNTTPPRRTVSQVSVDMLHHWYFKRWTVGLGPALEWRWTHYNCDDFDKYISENVDNERLVNKATATHEKYGPFCFDQTHVSLGLMATVAFRVIPALTLGLGYAPRITCRSKLTYKELDLPGGQSVPQELIKSETGHFDHQLSIVATWRINLTKHDKK